MKIVQINTTCGIGSTGKICVEISKLLTEDKIENYIFYSSKSNGFELGKGFSNTQYIKFQALKSRLLGNYGFNSISASKKMIAEMEKIQPDIVHLHNIHGHDCCLSILLEYLKRKKIKVVWTFHDCWAFTGYCPHFTYAKCDKWQSKCNKCPQYKQYSWIWDKSTQIYKKKKKSMDGLNLTIVTPSVWLADLVGKSFLNKYPVEVIYNGIDLNVFKPTKNEIRNKYNIETNKKIILGVSFGWGIKKGVDVFVELSKRLDPEKYQIILVGTNEKDNEWLPDNIISIHKTQNQIELAEIYTAADVFVNPTREEVLGLVNIEALACGTPIVTFNTGGCPEVVSKDSGLVVACNDIDEMEKAIIEISDKNMFTSDDCIIQAEKFEANKKFQEYVKLYKLLV